MFIIISEKLVIKFLLNLFSKKKKNKCFDYQLVKKKKGAEIS